MIEIPTTGIITPQMVNELMLPVIFTTEVKNSRKPKSEDRP